MVPSILTWSGLALATPAPVTVMSLSMPDEMRGVPLKQTAVRPAVR